LPLALVHAFSDSVHYGAWLGLIPEEETRAEGSLTFKMSARSLLADLGAPGVIAAAIAMGVVLAASLVNLGGTRRIYFSIAGFHGYLEMIVLVFLAVRGRGAVVDALLGKAASAPGPARRSGSRSENIGSR